jgi:acyl carrier protein
MDSEQLVAKINGILMNEFELEPSSLRPESTLREGLGLDSLDAVDLTVALEKAFSVQISEETAKKMRTVADLYALARTFPHP